MKKDLVFSKESKEQLWYDVTNADGYTWRVPPVVHRWSKYMGLLGHFWILTYDLKYCTFLNAKQHLIEAYIIYYSFPPLRDGTIVANVWVKRFWKFILEDILHFQQYEYPGQHIRQVHDND